MNIWDILILVLIAGLVIWALLRARKRKKAGRCACGCEGCAAPCERKDESSCNQTGKDA